MAIHFHIFGNGQGDQISEMRNQLTALTEVQNKQNKILQNGVNVQAEMLRFEKRKYEGVLRKDMYEVPTDKLIVVVADFAGGTKDEGHEIADELGVLLTV